MVFQEKFSSMELVRMTWICDPRI